MGGAAEGVPLSLHGVTPSMPRGPLSPPSPPLLSPPAPSSPTQLPPSPRGRERWPKAARRTWRRSARTSPRCSRRRCARATPGEAGGEGRLRAVSVSRSRSHCADRRSLPPRKARPCRPRRPLLPPFAGGSLDRLRSALRPGSRGCEGGAGPPPRAVASPPRPVPRSLPSAKRRGCLWGGGRALLSACAAPRIAVEPRSSSRPRRCCLQPPRQQPRPALRTPLGRLLGRAVQRSLRATGAALCVLQTPRKG